MYSKKEKTITIRFPEKTKRIVEDLADKDTRTVQDEILVLVTEAIHYRNYSIKSYT